MFLGALSGFTVAITADRRAEEQAELISRRGGEVVFGPVIRTLPLSDEGALQAATEELIARPPDIVVLSTALGVRGWCSSAEGLGLAERLRSMLERAEVLARGPKAVGAALTFGVQVDWQTPYATYEEIIENLAGRSPVHPDGRPLRVGVQLDGQKDSTLLARIEALGVEVVGVPVYEWHLPDDLGPALRVVGAVVERTVDAVSFTSAHAVSNFVDIAKGADQLVDVLDVFASGDVVALCVGPATAARARGAGIERCVEPRTFRLGAMVQALVVAFAERSVTVDLRGIQLLLQGRLVSVDGGEPMRLTDRERDLLHALARRPGAVLSKKALLDEVWCSESDDHVVEVTVGRLRRRLGPAGDAIETVMRRGYRLAAS